MFGFGRSPTRALKRVKPPPALFFENAAYETSHTPDAAFLERYKYQRIFIYDDMMQGHHAHNWIKDCAVPFCTAFTAGSFIMKKKKLGKYTFPIALEAKGETNDLVYDPREQDVISQIKGELYKIETQELFTLDKRKKNTVECERKRVGLLIPATKVVWSPFDESWESIERCHVIDAWMYVGINSYWSKQIDAGLFFSPVQRFNPRSDTWLSEYYYFTKAEIDDGEATTHAEDIAREAAEVENKLIDLDVQNDPMRWRLVG